MAVIDVKVPNIGDFENVPVIEIQVKLGDEVKADDPLITLESDKAAMDVPSPAKGKVAEILVGLGQKVSEGSAILRLDVDGANESQSAPPSPNGQAHTSTTNEKTLQDEVKAKAPQAEPGEVFVPQPKDFAGVHAGPSVRRIAREFDVDLSKLKGTGEKGRITKEDVKRYLVESSACATTTGIPSVPTQDFAKFGAIEVKPLSRLKKLSGPHLHRAWLNVPHVTNADEADISDLETYRKDLDSDAKQNGYRVTLVSFLLKASVSALKAFPEVNASLAETKDALVLKRYYNIGVAVDTPDGLVVPVIRDCDRKGIIELSRELTSVSARMREGRINPADIQGSTFSISSLGGIGGTGFTPIVNAPEVAILGATRAAMKPLWDGAAFQPRLMLPLCLSYDHRVVDGALAARFLKKICDSLADVRQLVL